MTVVYMNINYMKWIKITINKEMFDNPAETEHYGCTLETGYESTAAEEYVVADDELTIAEEKSFDGNCLKLITY